MVGPTTILMALILGLLVVLIWTIRHVPRARPHPVARSPARAHEQGSAHEREHEAFERLGRVDAHVEERERQWRDIRAQMESMRTGRGR